MILFKTIKANYVDKWKDYEKTSSFKSGARWNLPNTPAMYLSSNAQNAMLEIANYMTSPKEVNKFFRLAVFEFPELKLHTVEPHELPTNWHAVTHQRDAKVIGDNYLNSKAFEGIVVPSATINHVVATHSINSLRRSVYANVVVNLERIGMHRIRLIDSFVPIYSNAMFN